MKVVTKTKDALHGFKLLKNIRKLKSFFGLCYEYRTTKHQIFKDSRPAKREPEEDRADIINATRERTGSQRAFEERIDDTARSSTPETRRKIY